MKFNVILGLYKMCILAAIWTLAGLTLSSAQVGPLPWTLSTIPVPPSGGSSAPSGALVPSSTSCPATCFCSALSRIVYCSRRGLAAIPDNIASDSLQLNINGNVFQTTTLQPKNFSGLASLEHLYISECGIERIEVC